MLYNKITLCPKSACKKQTGAFLFGNTPKLSAYSILIRDAIEEYILLSLTFVVLWLTFNSWSFVDYRKGNVFMLILRFLPFLLFVLLNSLTVKIIRTKFGYAFPVTLMVSALLMYISGMLFSSFSEAYIVLASLGVLAFIFIILDIRKPKFKRYFFSNGFFCIVILSIVIFAMDLGHKFTMWDEFSHWGKMVKEMLRINNFYSDSSSTLLVHKDYPPFLTLFETLWCKFSGGFSEATVTRGVHYFELGILAPYFFERIKFDSSEEKCLGKILKLIGLLFILILFVLIFNIEPVFNSIYSDVAVSLLFALAICMILDRDVHSQRYTYFAVALTQVSLILTKQVSISFVLLIWLFFTILYFKREKILLSCFSSAGLLIIPILAFLSWENYTNNLGLVGQFDFSKISIADVLHIILGGGNEIQVETSRAYISALFNETITSGFLNFSYVTVGVLAIFIALLFVFSRDVDTTNVVSVKLCILFSVGMIGYAFMMHVLYMFCYSETEMTRLASYNRYMGCFVLGEYLIILYYFMISFEDGIMKMISDKYRFILFLIVSLVVLDGSNLLYLFPRLHGDVGCDECRTEGEYILSSTEKDSRILLVGSNILNESYRIQFFLDSQTIDPKYLYKGVADYPEEDKQLWDEVIEDIQKDDYVYIYDKSNSVEEMLSSYSSDGCIEERRLYRVSESLGGLLLTKQP